MDNNFSLPVWKCRKIYCTTLGIGIGVGVGIGIGIGIGGGISVNKNVKVLRQSF